MLKHPIGFASWKLTIPLLAFTAAVSAANPSVPGYGEVKQEMAVRGKTVVLIQLKGEEKRFGSFEERNADIQAVQERVLARLQNAQRRVQSGVFNLRYRYKTIYGMTAEMDPSALDLLTEDPEVANVATDREVRAHTNESGPVIGADVAQGLGYTGSGITVAVLDTGIDTDNVDLVDDLVGQKSFLSGVEGNSAEDGNGHGTNVCGIITSKGSAAPKGIAPDAKIVAVKVLSDDGSGSSSDWIAGVDWVVQQKQANTFTNLRVINMSLGTFTLYSSCPCDSESENSLMSSSITSAKTNGIFVAVSSGNLGNTTQMAAPACLMDAVSVGATYSIPIWDLNRIPEHTRTISGRVLEPVPIPQRGPAWSPVSRTGIPA